MTGEELPLILFSLRNSSDPKKRRQYHEIAAYFKQIYNLEFDVMIDRRLILEDEQDEPVLIPNQNNRGFGTLSNENIHPVGIRLKEVKRVVDELIIQIIKDDFAIPLDYAAAGITESLLLLVALIGHERKTILLDEPALNLHPNMQRKILELLEQAVSVNDNQIILITHSPYFVDASRLKNTWKFVSKNKATNVIHIGRAIEMIDKQFGQKTTLLLGNIETRSLLFSRGTILVEGLSDKVVVEKIDKYLSLHGKGANIEYNEWVLTSVSGKNGLGTFIGLCTKLGVTYAAIVDRDAIRECETSIKIDSGEIRTSTVFLSLHQNGELTSQDRDILRKFESSMEEYKDKKGYNRLRYSQKCFKTLSQVAKKHMVFVFKKDLEGALGISKSKKDGKPLNALDKIQELIAHDKIPEEFFSMVSFLKEHIGSAEPPVKT
jgi:hypothetical protein